jgi:DOPA 4,5-dioxygenase
MKRDPNRRAPRKRTAAAPRITGWHAHVYYDPAASRSVAGKLRAAIARRFRARLGRWHDRPVGPHPQAMYQVAFPPELFAELVPWLMLNRAGLTVLVHPETGDAYADHTAHALWLGKPVGLDVEYLREG